MQTFFLGLLAIVVGAAFCFIGYRLFRILMPLWGFLAGFVAGAEGIAALFGNGFLSTVLGWVVGAVLGVVCGLLAYFFYWAAMVILCTSVGYSIGAGLMSGIGLPQFIAVIAGILLAVVAALVAILLNVPEALVTVFTALAGAGALLAGVLLWVGAIRVEDLGQGAVAAIIRASIGWLMIYLVLSGAGVVVQTLVSFSGKEYRLEHTRYQY